MGIKLRNLTSSPIDLICSKPDAANPLKPTEYISLKPYDLHDGVEVTDDQWAVIKANPQNKAMIDVGLIATTKEGGEIHEQTHQPEMHPQLKNAFKPVAERSLAQGGGGLRTLQHAGQIKFAESNK